ncbi:hypothetical protein H1C71_013917 [Ictidomys tridecemlineatus]|nr:hypothetical protein H1C71_013917 [Ictidomys tridecemlineatus]
MSSAPAGSVGWGLGLSAWPPPPGACSLVGGKGKGERKNCMHLVEGRDCAFLFLQESPVLSIQPRAVPGKLLMPVTSTDSRRQQRLAEKEIIPGQHWVLAP